MALLTISWFDKLRYAKRRPLNSPTTPNKFIINYVRAIYLICPDSICTTKMPLVSVTGGFLPSSLLLLTVASSLLLLDLVDGGTIPIVFDVPVYLAASGPDGDGSAASPYTLVASALAQINQNLTDGNSIVLYIFPGTLLLSCFGGFICN